MKKFKLWLMLALSLIFTSNLVTFSAQWKNLLEIKNGNIYAKVDIDSTSVRKKIENKQKILFFTIHGKLFEGQNGYDAITTYKANCNTFEVWKNSANIKVYNPTQFKSPVQVSSNKTEKLQGKEYTDFENALKQICQIY